MGDAFNRDVSLHRLRRLLQEVLEKRAGNRDSFRARAREAVAELDVT